MAFQVITAGILAALRLVFSKAFKDGLGSAPTDWQKVATEMPSTGAANLYGWLAKIPKMREWIGDRVLNRLRTQGYQLTNKKFEDSVAVAREDIEDDNVGMYSTLFGALGEAANEHVDEIVFAALKNGHTEVCHDGQPFFNASHPIFSGEEETASATQSNIMLPAEGETAGPPWFLMDAGRTIKPIIYQNRVPATLTSMTGESDEAMFMRDEFRLGVRARRTVGYTYPQLAVRATAPLTAANYEKAKTMLRMMMTDNQRPLNIKPTLLVVPPSLDSVAKGIIKAEVVNGTTNVNRDDVEILATAFVA
jgi:phage major head subunit gpT-like protein